MMSVRISNMTIAATNVDAMVAFYNAVLETDFQPIELFPGTTAYHGKLAGIPVLMCPNSVAQVDAKQNRQQFDFQVDDVLVTLDSALAHGGTALQSAQEHNGVIIASVYDPDGNSMVFSQPKA
jgi:predicted enzyme related to lactoylglutathione lyase